MLPALPCSRRFSTLLFDATLCVCLCVSRQPSIAEFSVCVVRRLSLASLSAFQYLFVQNSKEINQPSALFNYFISCSVKFWPFDVLCVCQNLKSGSCQNACGFLKSCLNMKDTSADLVSYMTSFSRSAMIEF